MKDRTLHRIGLVIVALAALLLGMPRIGTPLYAMPMSPADTSEVETRFEGYIKAIGAGKWLIGSQSVLVDSATVIIEKRGLAEVGAWVVVWGTIYENGSIRANIISVERPTGSNGPTYQFSGIISKQLPGVWIVDDLLVEITDQTQLIGEAHVGWLVWVVAEYTGDGFRGITIEAIAGAPEDLPIDFEGRIEAISAEQWRVDGREVAISTSTVILGTPMIDALAEVRATRDEFGQLHAHMIRVLDSGSDALLGALTDAAGVTQADAEPVDTPATSLNSIASPWSPPIAIATGLSDAARPSLAYSADGVAHAVWEVRGQVYYANQPPGQAWGSSRRIATGLSPTVVADNDGRVHALFHNEFFGNYEIYHLILRDDQWSLPINIARTAGVSMDPAIVLEGNGILRAAWMDNTPGYWTIYTGYYDGAFWRNYPVPNARGENPSIASASDGTVYLAWQDRVPTASDYTGTYDIFITQYKSGAWSLPVNVSTLSGVEATDVSITTTYDSMVHLTWVAGEHTLMYCTGRNLYWPVPQIVVEASKPVHGPRIIAEKGKVLHIAWDEGDAIRATKALPAPPAWPEPETIVLTTGQLKDVALTESRESGITIGWADLSLPNAAGVYASAQASNLPSPQIRVWLPLIATP